MWNFERLLNYYSFNILESFKSVYHSLWFLWISKWEKSDVWTLHIFLNPVEKYGYHQPPKCEFWIWCFSYDFMVVQLSPTAEPKNYIYSVACEVWLWVLDVWLDLSTFHTQLYIFRNLILIIWSIITQKGKQMLTWKLPRFYNYL